MTQAKTVFVLALGSLALPGCFFFDDYDYYDDDYYYDDYYYDTPNEIPPPYNDGTLLVEASAQSGDMGDIRGYASDAVATGASYYGTSTSVRLDSLGDDWWVMSYVNISNLDIVNAPAGTYTATSATYDGSQPYVSVTGCSGPTYGNYTFDSGSSDAEVTIVDNEDGSRTLEFRATFNDYSGGTQVAEGTMVYRQGDVAPPPTYDTYTTNTIVATDATQSGTMGDIATYDGSATASEGYYYGSSSSIRLDSIGDGWWVMSYVSVSNLDLATAEPGTYTYTSATYDAEAPQVNVTGCSGPTYGNYTFDAGAEQAEVTITDNGDGSRTVDLVAHFTAYDGTSQVANASFRYTIAETATRY